MHGMTSHTAYEAIDHATKQRVIVVRNLPEGALSRGVVLPSESAEAVARKLVHEATGEDLDQIEIEILKPHRH